MHKQTAQNALNYFLSDKFTFKGTDFGPLLEIVRELQQDISDGGEKDPAGGSPEDTS